MGLIEIVNSWLLLCIIAVSVEPSNGCGKPRQGGDKSQESKSPSQGIFHIIQYYTCTYVRRYNN